MSKRSVQLIFKMVTAAALVAVTAAVVAILVVIRPTADNASVYKLAIDAQTVSGQVPSPHASAMPAGMSSNEYGFSANELVWESPSKQAQELEHMKATGVSWVRIDMQWYTVQPTSANSYDWSTYDRVIHAINAHGLRVLAILDYAPAWAAAPGCRPSPDHKCAPADPQAFATYAAAAAARYGPEGVKDWEIWNEPNTLRFWYPHVDVNGYANLLKATYPAIKLAYVGAMVITGGLKSTAAESDVSPPNYIQALYTAGAQPYFDALGAHPYTYPTLPSDAAGGNGWAQMVKMHEIAVLQGDGAKKVWMTEVGAPTAGPYSVSESYQTQIVENAVRLHGSYTWAGPLFWYDYQDLGNNTEISDNFFGLVRPDGSHKPAYDIFFQAIRQRVF